MALLFPLALSSTHTNITVNIIRAHDTYYNNHTIIEDDLRLSDLVEEISLEVLQANPQIPEGKIITKETIVIPDYIISKTAQIKNITDDQFVVINSPTAIKLPLFWLNILPSSTVIIPIVQSAANYTDLTIPPYHFYQTLLELLPKIKPYFPIMPIIANNEKYIKKLTQLLGLLHFPFNPDIFADYFDREFIAGENSQMYISLINWLSKLRPHRKIITV